MSINALAKLRDDKAVPDGVDVETHIGRGLPSVKPVLSLTKGDARHRNGVKPTAKGHTKLSPKPMRKAYSGC